MEFRERKLGCQGKAKNMRGRASADSQHRMCDKTSAILEIVSGKLLGYGEGDQGMMVANDRTSYDEVPYELFCAKAFK